MHHQPGRVLVDQRLVCHLACRLYQVQLVRHLLLEYQNFLDRVHHLVVVHPQVLDREHHLVVVRPQVLDREHHRVGQERRQLALDREHHRGRYREQVH